PQFHSPARECGQALARRERRRLPVARPPPEPPRPLATAASFLAGRNRMPSRLTVPRAMASILSGPSCSLNAAVAARRPSVNKTGITARDTERCACVPRAGRAGDRRRRGAPGTEVSLDDAQTPAAGEAENQHPEVTVEELPEALRQAVGRAGWTTLMPVQ